MAIRKLSVYSWKQTCLKHQQLAYKINGSVTCNFLLHNEGKKHINPPDANGNVVLEIPCDRCLEPVHYKIDIDYFKDLDMNKTAEEKIAELDEEYYLGRYKLRY